MKRSLKYIASIQTGVFAKPIAKGEIVYLQSKHFDAEGKLVETLYPDLESDNKIQKHLLQYGDVLFAAKGTKNFAVCYEENNLPAVASTSFFVIRINYNDILPEYLVWFLNHPSTQQFLKSKAKGTSIASISKEVLSELEISIPTTHKQRIIISIDQLRSKEKHIKAQLESLKERQIQQQIINVIK